MKAAFLALFLAITSSLSANAEITAAAPFLPPGSVNAWQKDFLLKAKRAEDPSRFAECREVSQLPGALLCQFASRRSMNAALTRAAIFTEGLRPFQKGEIARLGSAEIKQKANHISGHDLTGADLLAFFKATEIACADSAEDPAVCLNPAEIEIRDLILGPRAGQPIVLITFSADNKDALATVTHEILHAQYYLVPAFREAVDSYWTNDLSEEGRAEVRDSLSDGYDPTNEALMRNEFQAFLLEANAEEGMLGHLVGMMRKPLLIRLQQAGLTPLEIR